MSVTGAFNDYVCSYGLARYFLTVPCDSTSWSQISNVLGMYSKALVVELVDGHVLDMGEAAAAVV